MKSSPVLIDCEYVKPRFAGAYLIQEKSEGAFVENNTSHAVPLLLKALKEAKIQPKDVKYAIITHVHLDHAGGSSALVKACPNVQLLAHPRAAKHLIDPSKLVSSARAVYGAEVFDRLYGTIEVIPAERVRALEDGERVSFGSRSFEFFYTRGHANHHFCVLDSGSDGVFAGDSFGLAYPDLQKNGLFIFPSTSPTDFDAAEARASVHKIVNCGAKKAYLTHFGEVTDLKAAATQLLTHIDFHEQVLEQAIRSSEPDESLEAFCDQRLKEYFKKLVEQHGLASDSEAWDYIKLDVEINAQGLAFVAQKQRASASN